jgi:hypothetical protein
MHQVRMDWFLIEMKMQTFHKLTDCEAQQNGQSNKKKTSTSNQSLVPAHIVPKLQFIFVHRNNVALLWWRDFHTIHLACLISCLLACLPGYY